ncbi:hypothetical protein DUNSADRAFT_5616 [Dunaliella salina]|uniref:Secreted protein n=1 Tax=Dunaliella salina TaxID=3046 RepID=A0ABQ7FVX4_DUNSA|nr:hypothetical protein DUNSADRAFT_2912 [Dunaliella salina]KAF5836657.1 hypothetical protein DUNSADRAFT_5616 [Dunaliella salina]|eukprot:KAF5826493.1 hypothetical protein DUNSADRAFT_2912 [Dunaliella salina]
MKILILSAICVMLMMTLRMNNMCYLSVLTLMFATLEGNMHLCLMDMPFPSQLRSLKRHRSCMHLTMFHRMPCVLF